MSTNIAMNSLSCGKNVVLTWGYEYFLEAQLVCIFVSTEMLLECMWNITLIKEQEREIGILLKKCYVWDTWTTINYFSYLLQQSIIFMDHNKFKLA